MKQITIISGKGGTGKTVIAASLAALAKNAGFADCDVDAADLHLLLNPEIKERHEFKSGLTAFINKELCTNCGKCREICRFSAISGPTSGGDIVNGDFKVDDISCEGCAFCSFICPADAIEMKEEVCGEWFISETRFGPLVHAKLGIAKENSGKLVSLVRQKAKEVAKNKGYEWIIIDGSPGTGCPVIASITEVDCALVVTEPTLSGLHDADRVIKVASHFKVPVKLVINKYDLNEEMAEKIERYCKQNNIEVIGKIPFDRLVVEAMVNGKTIIEYASNKVTECISGIWESLKKV
ncbi:MAG: P-loop NTPase [Candidatus Omnitrophica bacterium]|nr:P-loop NTPase [Candidatus Omnitrophota bacterium]